MSGTNDDPIEKPTVGFQLPRSVIKWVAIGLVLSSAVVIVISLYSGVKVSDFERIGYLTFGLAATASVARLIVQVLRFRVITVGLAGNPKMDLNGLALARISSEFISISTPATSTGVVLRTAWLAGKGVSGGKAIWIGYFEVLIEVYVGAGLAIIAAVYAFLKGAIFLGATIATVALVLIVGYTVVFVLPARGAIKMPRALFRIAQFLVGGPRATGFYVRAVVASLNFSISARAILTKDMLPVLVKAVLLTVTEDVLSGAALWLVLNAAGLKIDLLSSTIATFGAITVAQVPVSIGGAGITEITMQTYLTAVFGFSSWAAIVLWRVATYQVLLAATGIIFVVFLRKSTKHRGQESVKSSA